MSSQFDLFAEGREQLLLEPGAFVENVVRFSEFGKRTVETVTEVPHDSGRIAVPTFVNEFWTAKQRAAHSLHEISYRACFKPQLPRFFITRLTEPGQVVYDPFMGRGTTVLESGLLRRRAIGTDVNPLGTILVKPRFAPPTSVAVARRLQEIDFQDDEEFPEELLAFYHTDTLREMEMIERSGRRTVPQIFVNDQHLGGNDDLLAAEASGRFDEILYGREQGEAA